VSIFRRGNKGPGRHAADRPRPSSAETLQDEQIRDEALADEALGDEASAASAAPDVASSPAEASARRRGPYDEAEAPAGAELLDLGSLRVAGVAGMELRLEVEEGSQQVVGVTAVLGESAVQLQAFAAPRNSGIWDDIRGEIAQSVVGQGGTADEVDGELGTELRARMPSAGPDGRTVFAPARFVGLDGPRWFLRAVFSGRAAIEPEAAAPLMDVLRGTVVVRGEGPMAPRELLPLRLPQHAAAGGEAAADDGSADGLTPFQRGPEITEVR
jgi:hypothetical protein